MDLFDWLSTNKDWLWSGFRISIFSILISIILFSIKEKSKKRNRRNLQINIAQGDYVAGCKFQEISHSNTKKKQKEAA